MGKPTICLDFDGVVHAYTSGWKGPDIITDGPVEGAIEWILVALHEGWDVAIYSSRSSSFRGRRAMKQWLKTNAGNTFMRAFDKSVHGADVLLDAFVYGACWDNAMEEPHVEAERAGRALVKAVSWPWFKPPAVVTIDDRAICFNGLFPRLQDIEQFRPWNR